MEKGRRRTAPRATARVKVQSSSLDGDRVGPVFTLAPGAPVAPEASPGTNSSGDQPVTCPGAKHTLGTHEDPATCHATDPPSLGTAVGLPGASGTVPRLSRFRGLQACAGLLGRVAGSGPSGPSTTTNQEGRSSETEAGPGPWAASASGRAPELLKRPEWAGLGTQEQPLHAPCPSPSGQD